MISLKNTLMAAVGLVALAVPVSAEFELSLYGGTQSAPHSNVTGHDLAVGGNPDFSFTAGWEGRSGAMPPYYGLRGMWWQSSGWGFGVDFTHSKIYADDATLNDSGFEVLEFSDGLNNLTLNIGRRWENAGSRYTPYVQAGVGVILPHVEVQTTAAAPRTFEYQYAGPSVALVAGLDYELNDRWSVFGEYKFTYSMLDVDLVGGGDLQTDVITNALNIGVTLTF